MSPAPAQVGQNQAADGLTYVFPESCAAFLGVRYADRPRVDSVFAVLDHRSWMLENSGRECDTRPIDHRSVQRERPQSFAAPGQLIF